MWITVPEALPGSPPEKPDKEESLWTDVDYVVAAAEDTLARTHFLGDALPVYNPWLGPDQFAAWLGAELSLEPRMNTSWVKPFVTDWEKHPKFGIDPENQWWKLYLEILHRSVEAGQDKWVTAFPDLHTGLDGLSAIRGPENLLIDLVDTPELIHRAMLDMTELFKSVMKVVSKTILPAGQGTSNWTMGWSGKSFMCIGQNDFSCMISPEMFAEFSFQDNLEACNSVDYSIYHLDGPGAVRHLPKILEIDNLDCVQWIQGAGNPPPSRWLGLLREIQDRGKSVQVYYGPSHGDDADLSSELEILCRELDWRRLFFWAITSSVEEAEGLVGLARKFCR
jgi:hypothetical protein